MPARPRRPRMVPMVTPTNARHQPKALRAWVDGRAAGAHAQLEEDVDVAMPVGRDSGGGQARTVQGEVVRRSRGQRAARVRGGRRTGGRAGASGVWTWALWALGHLRLV